MAFSVQLIFLVHIYTTTFAHFLVKDIEPSMQKILDLEADMSKVKLDLALIMERLEFPEKGREPTVSPPATTATKTITCTDGWLHFQGSCYYFGQTAVSFRAAQDYCSQQGAHLVHVETEAENTFLKDFMLNNLNDGRSRWIGITDAKREGVWKFAGRDTTASFFDWNPGEPNNTDNGTEDCAAATFQWQCKWNDVRCDQRYYGLCEKEVK